MGSTSSPSREIEFDMKESELRGRSSLEIFERFLTCKLHDKNRVLLTHPYMNTEPICVARISFKRHDVVLMLSHKKGESKHVERRIVDYIDKRVSKGAILKPGAKIIIYSTFSPCSDCIKKSMESGYGITYIFSAIYFQVPRPSCEKRGCECFKIDEDFTEPCRRALKRLGKSKRVEAKRFTPEDWEELEEILARWDKEKSLAQLRKVKKKYEPLRRLEDDELQKDYDTLAGIVPSGLSSPMSADRDAGSSQGAGKRPTSSENEERKFKTLKSGDDISIKRHVTKSAI
ncbi:uncharacterized protein [Diadema setosum]|uniref:uncharacterized protein n=1 Tax=Diadema setosum TaxID=31175 RepID=UPI003B3A3B46